MTCLGWHQHPDRALLGRQHVAGSAHNSERVGREGVLHSVTLSDDEQALIHFIVIRVGDPQGIASPPTVRVLQDAHPEL